MHEEEIDVSDVVDKESFMARGHHMAGLLVGAETDLRDNLLIGVHFTYPSIASVYGI